MLIKENVEQCQILRTLQAFAHYSLVLTHFTDEELEAQRGLETSQGSPAPSSAGSANRRKRINYSHMTPR